MSANSANGTTAESSVAVAIVNVPAMVANSVTQTNRQFYDSITSGVQWYFEQWEDLVEEAKASLSTDAESIGVSDILAGLAEAKVASDIPGRIRLRLKQLRGHDDLATQSAQALGRLSGITEVDVSALTGSILIFYDTAQYESRDALVRAIAAHA